MLLFSTVVPFTANTPIWSLAVQEAFTARVEMLEVMMSSTGCWSSTFSTSSLLLQEENNAVVIMAHAIVAIETPVKKVLFIFISFLLLYFLIL
jgi:hypothetical protein